jgi:zinc protease
MSRRKTTRSAAEIGRTQAGPRPLPPLGAAQDFALPEHAETTLPSGLRVIALRVRTVPMAEVRLSIPFAVDDAARTDLLAEVLLAGAGTRDRAQIDTALASIGGDVGAAADPEGLRISASCLLSGLPELLALISEVASRATLPESEVSRERDRLLDRLAMISAQPGMTARRALLRHAFDGHPVSREFPEADEVRGLTATDVRALYSSALPTGGAWLVIVTDLEPDKVLGLAGTALAGWSNPAPPIALPSHEPVAGGPVALVGREDAVQSQIRLIGAGVGRDQPEYTAVKLANLVFGGYFSSRLVENLREDKGYTYSASSGLDSTAAGHSLMVGLDSARETTAAALVETFYELSRMVVDGPTDAEVDAVREFALGALPLSLSTQSALAGTVSRLVSLGVDLSWLAAHRAQLADTTAAEVRAAAATWFAPTRFTGIVQGDPEILDQPLRSVGWIV